MPDYSLQDVPQIRALKEMAARISRRLTALESATDATAIRAVAVDGNTVKFFNSTDTTSTAVYQFSFPEELFLDQAATTLVENFTFSAEAYAGATNPNLDGKTVLVLAVKGDAATPTVKYSFVNLEKLIDTYAASDTSLTINGYSVKVNISAQANNALLLKADGLHVDISGKVDRVSGATTGNLVVFDSNGGISDSGSKIATNAEFTAMLDEVLPIDSGGD